MLQRKNTKLPIIDIVRKNSVRSFQTKNCKMPLEKLEIRPCLVIDIPQVLDINFKWQRRALGINLKDGFITGDFDSKYLKKSIEKNEIVVTVEGKKVVGYSMVKDGAQTRISQTKYLEMVAKGYLSSNVRVALGTQTALNLEYHGKGIGKAMTRALVANIKAKYDIMISSVNKKNIKSLKRHQKNNDWIIFDEDEELIYLFYDLHKKNKNQKYFLNGPISGKQDLIFKKLMEEIH